MIKHLISLILIPAIVGGLAGIGVDFVKHGDFSGITHLSGLEVGTDGFAVGTSSPTTITKILAGTCNLSTSQGALEATSTDDFYCAAPGVNPGDVIFVQLPRAGATTGGGFVTEYAVATATDMIGVGIFNATGAATSSFAQATTSVNYFVFDF